MNRWCACDYDYEKLTKHGVVNLIKKSLKQLIGVIQHNNVEEFLKKNISSLPDLDQNTAQSLLQEFKVVTKALEDIGVKKGMLPAQDFI